MSLCKTKHRSIWLTSKNWKVYNRNSWIKNIKVSVIFKLFSFFNGSIGAHYAITYRKIYILVQLLCSSILYHTAFSSHKYLVDLPFFPSFFFTLVAKIKTTTRIYLYKIHNQTNSNQSKLPTIQLPSSHYSLLFLLTLLLSFSSSSILTIRGGSRKKMDNLKF